MILISKLHEDKEGVINLKFRKYLGNKGGGQYLSMLKERGTIKNFFSKPVSANINSLNIAYMNSLHKLTCYEKGYQISTRGPDSYTVDYEKVDNHLGLTWNINAASSFLPITREHRREFFPRRLLNSLGKMNLYVIAASQIKKKYIHFSGKKLFLIPFEI